MEHTITTPKIVAPSNSTNDKVKWNDDFFSALTIEECERHFEEHYENNLDQFAENKDKLSLLKSIIELLNRLEDTTNNQFAGRVLIFLARVIPLFDQSGVNLRSEFSSRDLPQIVSHNLRQIGLKNAQKDVHSSHMISLDIEEGETLSDDESNGETPQEDSDLIYERFWKIQQYLYQPNQLYDKNIWFAFRTHVDTIIHQMENKPAKIKVWKLNTPYMTDLKSFSIQVDDVNMRRCFLVQLLIVLQYLELPVDIKSETFALDKVQLSWSSTIVKKICCLLDVMPNPEEGRRFLGLIRHILKREEIWNKWKNDKCKEPKKSEDDEEPVSMRATYHKRRKISDELGAADAYNMHVIGSPEMSRLWNMKEIKKFDRPDVVSYLNIPAEKQDLLYKDPNYSFRLLRLLRRDPSFYGPTPAAIQTLDVYLKSALTRFLNPDTKVTKVAENNE